MRAFFVIPIVVPPVATAFIWFTLFQPDTGLINRVLTSLGLPQVSLSNSTTALIAVIAFGAWQFFGEVVLLYLAALKSLPRDVLEAAAVDGAGAWQRLRFIRLPLLRQQTALIAVVATLQRPAGVHADLRPDATAGRTAPPRPRCTTSTSRPSGWGRRLGRAGRRDGRHPVRVSLIVTVAPVGDRRACVRGSRQREDRASRRAIAIYLLVGVSVLIVLFPLLWMVASALKTNGEIINPNASLIPTHLRWANLVDAWRAAPFGRFFVNTAVFSVVTTVGQIVTGHARRLRVRDVRLPAASGCCSTSC